MNIRKLAILTLCLSLTGCAGGKVLFNKEDPRSGFIKTNRVTLSSMPLGNCEPLSNPNVTGVDVALAGGTLAYSLMKSEVNHWIERKISAYSFTYQAISSYYPQSNQTNLELQEMCFQFARYALPENKGDNIILPDISFNLGIIRFKSSKAFIVKISKIKLERSGALTTKNEGLDLLITTTISTYPLNESNEPVILSNSNIPVQNVGFTSYDRDIYGPVIKQIPYNTPVTIAVVVKEQGIGVENLKTLQEDVKNNTDAAKALLDVAIKKHYE